MDIPCSFRNKDFSGQPETLPSSERPLEVMEDLLRSRKRKGAFCFCLWERKRKDYLNGILCLWQVRSEILLGNSKQKTALVIRYHIISRSATQEVMFSRYLQILFLSLVLFRQDKCDELQEVWSWESGNKRNIDEFQGKKVHSILNSLSLSTLWISEQLVILHIVSSAPWYGGRGICIITTGFGA